MTANTMAVHLKKSLTCSPPLKSYLKTCPRSYHRGGCASCPVYPLKYRAARAVSQVRGGGGLSASGSFSCLSALLFVFVLVFRHHHTSKTGFFLQMACPLSAFNVIYIIARFYCVVYTKKALYLPFIFVQVSQTLKPAKTFSKRIIVQILYTIVPITKFYLCSRCTIFRLRKENCLYKITYLLLISQSLCLSVTYNTPPGVSCLLVSAQCFN